MLARTIGEFASAGWPSEYLIADPRDSVSSGTIVDAMLTGFGTIDALINDAIATNGPKALVDIDVNAICPFADSPGVQFWQEIAPKDYDRALRAVPVKRAGRTREDIGAVVAFPIGADGRFFTGQTAWSTAAEAIFADYQRLSWRPR